VALRPAPPRESASNNKGLIYGLSGLGAVLLIAMGVVALTSDRGGGDAAPLDIAAPVSSTSAGGGPGEPASPAAAQEEPAPEPEPEPEPSKPASTTRPASTQPRPAASPASRPSQPAPAASPPAAPVPAAPAPTPSAPAAQPAPTPSSPAPTPAPQPPAAKPPVSPPAPPVAQPSPAPPSTADACTACGKAAANRDIVGANRAFAQCTNPVGRKQCTALVAQVAPKVAEAAAFNQQCGQAREVIAAALQMGVPPARMAKATTACK